MTMVEEIRDEMPKHPILAVPIIGANASPDTAPHMVSRNTPDYTPGWLNNPIT